MIRMDKIVKTCTGARLLEMGVDPDDLDKIRQETGCTTKQSEQIRESMRDQLTFLKWLDKLDRDMRA